MARSETAVRLQGAVVSAMKARDRERLGVLRMLQAAVKQKEVDGRQELDEPAVIQVIASYARKVKDQLDGARAGGRADLVSAAERELAVVQEFLPAELGDDELSDLVREAIAETGAASPRDMGQVMKAVLPRVAGRADGGRVSAEVKRQLGA
ncbi:MAG: GatB/YqeY domain-containing protein [Candidatus Krumholzibacteriia bacterium]